MGILCMCTMQSSTYINNEGRKIFGGGCLFSFQLQDRGGGFKHCSRYPNSLLTLTQFSAVLMQCQGALWMCNYNVCVRFFIIQT